jgi:acyl dehydratase
MSSEMPQAGAAIESTFFGPIAIEHLVNYAKASGDFNLIHSDLNAAREVGLPGIIAHGMLSAGLLAERATQFMKPWQTQWKLHSFQTRFKGMIFLDDTVGFSGVVKSIDETNLRLDLVAKNQRGETVTTATAMYHKKS